MRDETKFFYTPVYWAHENGITSGTTAVTFSPYQPVTREQAASFLYTFCNGHDVGGTSSFADMRKGSYYENAVKWLASNHIMNGYTPTRFGVGDPMTRGQAVTVLWGLSCL